jgi:UDP-GlcNAc:undecaprenyl-phosphate GlcNAc-1-phosphate transferase
LGGAAVFSSFVIILGVFLAIAALVRVPVGVSGRLFLFIVGPATLVFVIGLLDDIYSLNAYIKFGLQTIPALLLFAGGYRLANLSIFGDKDLGFTISLVLTVFWVLLVTNAFNLIDGLDGLAAGSALFSTLVVFIVSAIFGQPLALLLTVCLAGSILGFLRFNFNPASIFLGDCGSLVIGFLLSAVSLASSQKTPTIIAVAIPVVSFGLPILDTFLSVVRRFLNGRPLFRADGEHIHHKLIKRGLTHRQAVVVLYAVSATFGAVSLLLLHPATSTVGMLMIVLGIGVWVGVQQLGYHEIVELRRLAQRTVEQKRVIANNLAIRRSKEELSKVKSFGQICGILEVAFNCREFDVCELICTLPLPDDLSQRYRWANPLTEPGKQSPAWTLRLELITKNGEDCGSLSVSRLDPNRPFLVDVNCLLDGEFSTTIADALLRASANSLPGPLAAAV